MADFSTLMASIEATIKENGQQAITGDILQDELLQIVNAVNVLKQDTLRDAVFGGVVAAGAVLTPSQPTFYFHVAAAGSAAGTVTINGNSVAIPAGVGLYLLTWDGTTADRTALYDGSTFPSDVFVATYGSTTYGEVMAANSAGKVVVVKYNSIIYTLTDASSTCIFSALDGSSRINTLWLSAPDAWGAVTKQAETTDNKVTQITDAATDVQYPSAKAVKDALADIEGEVSQLGQEINDLDDKITEIARPEFDINNNPISGEYIVSSDGTARQNSNYNRTDYIELFKGPFLFGLKFGLQLTTAVAIAFYDENKKFVFSIGGPTTVPSYVEQEVDFSEHPNVRYFRASLRGGNIYAYCNKKIESIIIPDGAITTPKIADGAVTTPKIADGAVTEQKTIFFEHDDNSNFIDRSKLTPGYYIDANGVPRSTPSSNYFITDKVYLAEGETYYKGNLYGGYCAFYQEDGTLVQGYGSTAPLLPNPFVVPQGAVYGRFTINSAGADQTCWISKSNAMPIDYRLVIKRNFIPAEEITPANYPGRDISTFAKIMCIGDSLTEGAFNYLSGSSFSNNTTAAALGRPYSYPQYLQKLTGCEVTNLGKSGFTSKQWYDYYTTGAGASVDFSGYDCAIIQLGVNDVASTLDTVTKEALDNIISKVKTANAGIKIFLAGMINAKSYPAAVEGESYYAKDQWLRNYYNTYYANDNQVFFVDHVAYGHLRTLGNAQHGGSYVVDNYNEGHLSAYGYWRLAQDYVNIIGYIMSHNAAQDFRKIQFIGTDYQCY